MKLRPLSAGIDFLGYVVFPTRTVVRRRVVGHAVQKLDAWARQHVRGARIRATPCQLRELRSVHDSYSGHFSHADSYRLVRRLHRRFPWLATAMLPRDADSSDDHRPIRISI